jgi:DnaJ family protein C protein 28
MPRPRTPAPRPLIRRDAEGRARTAPDWETLTERLIREALEAGAFDELPHRGQRIPLADDTLAGEMALAHHVLRNAGAAPPWIETDKEVRRLAATIERLLERASRAAAVSQPRLERELEALLDTHDAAVLRLEGSAPTPRQQRRRLDRATLRERLRRASTDGPQGP